MLNSYLHQFLDGLINNDKSNVIKLVYATVEFCEKNFADTNIDATITDKLIENMICINLQNLHTAIFIIYKVILIKCKTNLQYTYEVSIFLELIHILS